MSNYLAIASVTAVLKHLVDKALQASHVIDGAGEVTVTTVRPSDRTAITKRGVNVFLHHTTPNPQWRNGDLPTRRGDGTLVRRPAAAIDLHYVMTFHGDDARWEPQRYYGVVLRTLHSQPVLSRELVKQVLDSIGSTASFGFMRKSDLAAALEQVRVVPAPLSLDELSKVWSSFYQIEYSLAAMYTASPVIVETDDSALEPLPVRRTGVRAMPFASPTIERVRRGDDAPITAGSQLRIEGSHLRGDVTQLLLDGVVAPGPLDLGQELVVASLPAALRAGIHSAQVVHSIALGSPATPHRGPESNAHPFTLHPIIGGAPAISDRSTRVDGGVTYISGTLALPLSPDVGPDQRVLLLLNGAAAGAAPGYSFTAAERPAGPDAATVAIAFTDVRAGTYWLRAQVDGATSVPSPGPDLPTLEIG